MLFNNFGFFLKRSAVICLLRGLHCATELLLLACHCYYLAILPQIKTPFHVKSGILDQNLTIFGSKILKYPKKWLNYEDLSKKFGSIMEHFTS